MPVEGFLSDICVFMLREILSILCHETHMSGSLAPPVGQILVPPLSPLRSYFIGGLHSKFYFSISFCSSHLCPLSFSLVIPFPTLPSRWASSLLFTLPFNRNLDCLTFLLICPISTVSNSRIFPLFNSVLSYLSQGKSEHFRFLLP